MSGRAWSVKAGQQGGKGEDACIPPVVAALVVYLNLSLHHEVWTHLLRLHKGHTDSTKLLLLILVVEPVALTLMLHPAGRRVET